MEKFLEPILSFLSSGIFLFIINFFIRQSQRITVQPKKDDRVYTIFMWSCLTIFGCMLYTTFTAGAKIITLIKSNNWLVIAAIIFISIMTASYIYLMIIIFNSLKYEGFIVPFYHSKFPLIRDKNISLWIIKPLENDRLLCVKSLEDYNNGIFTVVSGKILENKIIQYTKIK